MNSSAEFPQSMYQQQQSKNMEPLPNNGGMNRKPSQQSDRMSIASGRTGVDKQSLFTEAGQKMIRKQDSDFETNAGPGAAYPYITTNSHREPQHLLDVSYQATGSSHRPRMLPKRGGGPGAYQEIAIKNANERSISSNRLPNSKQQQVYSVRDREQHSSSKRSGYKTGSQIVGPRQRQRFMMNDDQGVGTDVDNIVVSGDEDYNNAI